MNLFLVISFFLVSLLSVPVQALTVTVDGVHSVRGQLTYTNAYFAAGMSESLILLEDQTGFITRNRTYIMPAESQTLGYFTSDISTSPASFQLSLPLTPNAPLHDVDNNGQSDTA